MLKPRNNPDKYKHVPKQYMKVAEGMESQFTNHLINEMRKSAQSSQTGPAENIYNSMLDAERAKIMAETNSGLGIKDVVLRELYPNFDKPNIQNVKMYKQINSGQGVDHE